MLRIPYVLTRGITVYCVVSMFVTPPEAELNGSRNCKRQTLWFIKTHQRRVTAQRGLPQRVIKCPFLTLTFKEVLVKGVPIFPTVQLHLRKQ